MTQVGIGPRMRRRLIGVGAAAALLTAPAVAAPPARAAGIASAYHAYQLHAVFFSREARQPRVIDPQMFVAAPGSAGGIGPQMIRHVAGVLPVLAADPAATPLLDALGRPLGVTLGRWEAARGTATLTCRGGSSTLVSRFTDPLPRAAYSLFVVHLRVQGPRRFTPLGAPDGRGSSFITGPSGTWTETSVIAPCLTLSEAVVLVWDSDGRSHGPLIGQPGVTAHNHLIVPLG